MLRIDCPATNSTLWTQTTTTTDCWPARFVADPSPEPALPPASPFSVRSFYAINCKNIMRGSAAFPTTPCPSSPVVVVHRSSSSPASSSSQLNCSSIQLPIVTGAGCRPYNRAAVFAYHLRIEDRKYSNKMAKWFRSEPMEYISLIMNEDAAHDCLADLGKLGVIQFTDVRQR